MMSFVHSLIVSAQGGMGMLPSEVIRELNAAIRNTDEGLIPQIIYELVWGIVEELNEQPHPPPNMTQEEWGFLLHVYDHIPTDPEVLGGLITVACNMKAIHTVIDQYSFKVGLANAVALDGDLAFCKDHFRLLAETLISRWNLRSMLDIVSRMRIPLNWNYPTEIRMDLFPWLSTLNR